MKKKRKWIIMAVLLLMGTTIFMSRRLEKGDAGDQGGSQNSQMSGEGVLYLEDLPETDLNRNGIPEEIRIVEAEDGEGKELEVWENGERIFREVGFYVHAGQKAMFLCRLDGEIGRAHV